MKTILVLVAAAAVLFVAGCGDGGGTFNVDERISKEIGSKAVCSEMGFEEVAGEREMMYQCSLSKDYGYSRICVFIDKGEFYIARHEGC